MSRGGAAWWLNPPGTFHTSVQPFYPGQDNVRIEKRVYITIILILNVQQTGISTNLHIILEMIFVSKIKETDA